MSLHPHYHEITPEQKLANFDVSSQNNRGLTTSFLLLCAYMILTGLSIRDVMIFTGTASFSLPILGLDVDMKALLQMAPLGLLIFHLFILFNLRVHLSKLSETCANPEQLYPFYVNFLNAWHSPLLRIYSNGMVLAVYGLAPVVTLWLLRAKMLRFRDLQLTIGYGAYMAVQAALLCYLLYALYRYNMPSLMRQFPHFHWRRTLFVPPMVGLLFCAGPLRNAWEDIHHMQEINGDLKTLLADSSALALARKTGLRVNQAELDQWWAKEFPGVAPGDQSYHLVGRNLRFCTITGVRLNEGDFTRAQLDFCRITDSEIKGSTFEQTHLTRINLTDTTLDHVIFKKADLEGANLTRTEVKDSIFDQVLLHNAQVVGATFEKIDFINVSAQAANFQDSVFKEADWTQVHLKNTLLNEVEWIDGAIQNSTLKGGSALKIKLRGAKSPLVLEDVTFQQVDFSDSVWQNVEITDSTITSSRIEAAKFFQTKVQGSSFGNSNLQKAQWFASTLKDSLFEECQLNHWQFENPQALRPLAKTHFVDSDLSNSQWGDADLGGATWKGSNLNAARGMQF